MCNIFKVVLMETPLRENVALTGFSDLHGKSYSTVVGLIRNSLVAFIINNAFYDSASSSH